MDGFLYCSEGRLHGGFWQIFPETVHKWVDLVLLNLSYLPERNFYAVITSRPIVITLTDRSLSDGKLNEPETIPYGDA